MDCAPPLWSLDASFFAFLASRSGQSRDVLHDLFLIPHAFSSFPLSAGWWSSEVLSCCADLRLPVANRVHAPSVLLSGGLFLPLLYCCPDYDFMISGDLCSAGLFFLFVTILQQAGGFIVLTPTLDWKIKHPWYNPHLNQKWFSTLSINVCWEFCKNCVQDYSLSSDP